MKPQWLIFSIAVLLLTIGPVSAQSKEVRFLIDTSMTIMKQNAVNANTVDWNKLKRNVLAKAADITDAYQIGPVIRYLYQ